MHNFWPLDVSLIVTRIFNVSAEGASEKFRAFYRGTTYDVIIFKFQGEALAPCPPPPVNAHDHKKINQLYEIERLRTLVWQVGRAAYEIMQTRHADASSRVRSLDRSFFFTGGAHPHYQVVVISHTARNRHELDLHVGDRVNVLSNHYNGLSHGRNLRSNRDGLFPSFKVQDTVDTVQMPPTYPEFDNS